MSVRIRHAESVLGEVMMVLLEQRGIVMPVPFEDAAVHAAVA